MAAPPVPVAVSLDLSVVAITMQPPVLNVPRGMVQAGAMETACGQVDSA